MCFPSQQLTKLKHLAGRGTASSKDTPLSRKGKWRLLGSFLICSCIFSHLDVLMWCLLQRRGRREVMAYLHSWLLWLSWQIRMGPISLPLQLWCSYFWKITEVASGPWREMKDAVDNKDKLTAEVCLPVMKVSIEGLQWSLDCSRWLLHLWDKSFVQDK